MFSKSLHRIRRNGLRTAVAMGVSSLALVALTAPAGASTSSTKVSLTPVAVLAPQAAQSVDAADRKRKKKPHKKMGMGAKRPKTQLAAVLPAATITASLPATVDLSSYDVAVGNQGQVGSCVAWAIDYAMLGWYSKHDGRAGQPFHPMYTFSQIHSTNDADGGGSDPEDALTVAQ